MRFPRLADGSSHSYTARVEDAAGNAGTASSAFTLTVDTSAPATATITSYTDNAGSSTGNFGSGTTTDDATPVLNGTLSAGLAAGEALRIYDGSTLLGTASVAGTAWTFNLPAQADGSSHSYTAQVEDAAGNQGTVSNTFAFTVDYSVMVNSQTTTDTTPFITGTLPFPIEQR